MKRKHFLILSAVLLLTVSGAILTRILYSNHNAELFSLSLESLTDEEQPLGHCRENNSDPCCFACPNEQCMAVYYADGHYGDAYNISGNCIRYGTAF